MTQIEQIIADAREQCARLGHAGDGAVIVLLAATLLEYRAAASNGFRRLPQASVMLAKPASEP